MFFFDLLKITSDVLKLFIISSKAFYVKINGNGFTYIDKIGITLVEIWILLNIFTIENIKVKSVFKAHYKKYLFNLYFINKSI